MAHDIDQVDAHVQLDNMRHNEQDTHHNESVDVAGATDQFDAPIPAAVAQPSNAGPSTAWHCRKEENQRSPSHL